MRLSTALAAVRGSLAIVALGDRPPKIDKTSVTGLWILKEVVIYKFGNKGPKKEIATM